MRNLETYKMLTRLKPPKPVIEDVNHPSVSSFHCYSFVC